MPDAFWTGKIQRKIRNWTRTTEHNKIPSKLARSTTPKRYGAHTKTTPPETLCTRESRTRYLPHLQNKHNKISRKPATNQTQDSFFSARESKLWWENTYLIRPKNFIGRYLNGQNLNTRYLLNRGEDPTTQDIYCALEIEYQRPSVPTANQTQDTARTGKTKH